MKNDFNFNEVIDRAKKAFKINDDKALSDFIGMKANAFANRKKAQSLPYDELLKAADSENVSFDWLLTGRGEMLKNEVAEQKATYEVSLKTLYPELTEKEVQMFEIEIEEKIEFNRLKTLVYERFSANRRFGDVAA